MSNEPRGNLTRAGAEGLARRIERYWRNEGYSTIKAWVVPSGVDSTYAVLSNCVNGKPPPPARTPRVLTITLLAFISLPALAQEVASTDRKEVCGHVHGMSYSKQHRTKLSYDDRAVDFARASVPFHDAAYYELDHIIPLALGGADTPANRRPQPCDAWSGKTCVAGEAAQKDRLEVQAWRWVCRGPADLPWAQGLMPDWRASYRWAFGEEP